MKQLLCLLVFLAITFSFVGCQQPGADTNDAVYAGMEPTRDHLTLKTSEEFFKLRDAINDTDSDNTDWVWNTFRYSRKNGDKTPAAEKTKYVVELIDSLPYVYVIDSTTDDVVYINYEKGRAMEEDGRQTGEEFETVIISMQTSTDEWVRINYHLIIHMDLEKILSGRATSGHTVLKQPITNAEGNITVYSEKISDHPSGVGYLKQWLVIMDGIMAEINYYTISLENAISIDYFETASISSWDARRPEIQ